jgi:hypothetical protein
VVRQKRRGAWGIRLIPIVAALALITACASVSPPVVLPEPDPAAAGLLLVAHGYGNNPSHWPARLIERIVAEVPAADSWDIYAHDWEREANRPATAARRGYRIGATLAWDLLAAGDRYPEIHLVGQSLGAHLVQGFLDAYRDGGGAAAVQATFLDPFVIHGMLGFGWGVRRLGQGADFAECYIVRGEPAIGTNRYLRAAHNFDISSLVPPETREVFIGPHWWVVEFYRQSVGRGGPGFALAPMSAVGRRRTPRALGEVYPPGEVTRLN